MPYKQYRIQLTLADRQFLEDLVSTGTHKARQITRARILLLADEGPEGAAKTDSQIVDSLKVCRQTVATTRARFVKGGLIDALNEHPRSGQPPKFKASVLAHIIALACSHPPEGHARWTLRLLADKAVELSLVESISHETVRHVLKKNELHPHLKQHWCIAQITGEYLYRMEDVLSLYELP